MKIQIKLFLTAFGVLICGESKSIVTVSNITPYALWVSTPSADQQQIQPGQVGTFLKDDSAQNINAMPPNASTYTISGAANTGHKTWVIYYSPLDGTFRTDFYN